jgi:hypothetical protein
MGSRAEKMRIRRKRDEEERQQERKKENGKKKENKSGVKFHGQKIFSVLHDQQFSTPLITLHTGL